MPPTRPALGVTAALSLVVATPVAAQQPVPVGPEFRVNTTTPHHQRTPAVAMNAGGSFVVVWLSDEQDGDESGIDAQRYSADGTPLGVEFRANTHTTGAQRSPGVAMDADGDFVVAWESRQQDGAGGGVYAQRYDAIGTAIGTEFRVNTFTAGYESETSVGTDADGDFVVVWGSHREPPEEMDVFAQRFSASPVATEPGAEAGLALAVTPSPLTAGGRVRYEVPAVGAARLSLHDVLGREVAVLAEGTVAAGAHEAALDAAALAPGAYVLRLEADGRTLTRRVTVGR